MRVGETYEVPSIGGLPIIGEPHEDTDWFNIAPRHYHIDSRFLDDPTGAVLANAPVEMRPFRCIREVPLEWDATIITWGVTVKHATSQAVCGRCPHKGMPIQDGVCTGHRMRWLGDQPMHPPPFQLRSPVALPRWIHHHRELHVIELAVIHEWREPVWLELWDGNNRQVRGRVTIRTCNLRPGDTLRITLSGGASASR